MWWVRSCTGILGGAAAEPWTAGGLRLRADDTLRFLWSPVCGGGVEPERTHGCAAFAPAVFLSVSREGLDSTGSWEALVVPEDRQPSQCFGGCLFQRGIGARDRRCCACVDSFASGLPSMASSVAVRHALIDRRSSSRESCDLSDVLEVLLQ